MNKFLLFGFSILLLVGCSNDDVLKDNIGNDQVRVVDHEDRLSLIMAGDVLIHSAVYADAYENGEYDFSSMFSSVAPLIEPYDLAFYNQETIIGGKALGLSSYPRFNSPEEVADTLVDIGFNMVSVANNHTLDRGEEAIRFSQEYWNHKGVVVAGSSMSLEDRQSIPIYSKNNIRYALLAYTTTTNGLHAPSGKEYLVHTYDYEIVKQDIEKVRGQVDLLIVSMHWGTEYTFEPTVSQKEIASELASLGVDIVIGHHPHVIQPITFIDNTLVVYSLGNFISGQIGLSKTIGMLVSLDVVKKYRGSESYLMLDNVSSSLIYTYSLNNQNYQVIPFDDLNHYLLYNYQAIFDEYKLIINQYDGNILVNGGRS